MNRRKQIICIFLIFTLLFGQTMLTGSAATDGQKDASGDGQEMTLLFTHDMHDYFYPTHTVEFGRDMHHGGAAKLKTIVDENSDGNTLYIDGGDYSMGTLSQALFATDAMELRTLGMCGCEVTVFGNHEFDYGVDATADMLRAAIASGDRLPKILASGIDFSGELSDGEKNLKAAMEEYGVEEHTIVECAGYRIGLFGLQGLDSIECIQADVRFENYIESAKKQVAELQKENVDIIIAISHSGTEGEGKNGEDVELVKKVPGIDIVLSSHTHSVYEEPVYVNDTVIISAGEYLKYVGKMKFSMVNGRPEVAEYRMIPVDEDVPEDPQVKAQLETYKEMVNQNYLAGTGYEFDSVIAHSSFDMISMNEMFRTHQEYNIGDLIADSYIYEAKQNGVDDIDIAITALGTIRDSIYEGDVTTADAFKICSMGVGSDTSAGHPIVVFYVTGKEAKLMTELDASLGPYVDYIKMSYSDGFTFTFNTKRIIMDRVTEVGFQNEDGSVTEPEDDKLYKVAANMYAVNMLGMLNGITKGTLTISLRDENGVPIPADRMYDYCLTDPDGKEIKEWVAFADYMSSFEANEDGVPEIPDIYREAMGRKNKVSEGGFALISHPGTACRLVPTVIVGATLILLIAAAGLVFGVRHRRKKQKIAR